MNMILRLEDMDAEPVERDTAPLGSKLYSVFNKQYYVLSGMLQYKHVSLPDVAIDWQTVFLLGPVHFLQPITASTYVTGSLQHKY